MMITSYNWLKEYVDFDWSAGELADALTMAGLEVEGMDILGELPKSIVVAQIDSVTPHPNADKLCICQVDDGSGERLPVVCGAPNCEPGKKAAFARVGTVIGDLEIKKARLRGEISMGMLCAEDELGLSNDHSGIMILPDTAPVGEALVDYLGCDTRIEWEITPNRPDWLSHIGIAREIGALTGNPLRMPGADPAETGGDINDCFSVEVRDAELCPRYTARYIKNVTIQPSPPWLQQKLRSVGLRPINNVVDITNFILYECGQPLHAFDADKLRGQQIIVRRARDGETITTLDDQDHPLTPENLLIADAEGGVALAGVMGGASSEISESTRNVLLESAAFNPPNIRQTSKKLAIHSDSSYRFERGVDFDMVEFASARAARLICDLAGGDLAGGMIDVKDGPYQHPEVSLRFARVNQLIGIPIDPPCVKSLLARLGLEVIAEKADTLTLAIPPYRLDLTREVDLIEEIARLHGYDKIPARTPGGRVGGPLAMDDYYPTQELRKALIGLGFDECLHIATISQDEATKQTAFSAEQLIQIDNPLGQEFAILRPSLLPSMLQAIAHNIAHGNHDLRLFELGRAFANHPEFPEERMECCLALTGRKHPERFSDELAVCYDFYDLKGMLEDWLEAVGIRTYRIADGAHPAFQNGRCAEIRLADGTPAGVFGNAHKDLTRNMRLRAGLFIALIQLDPILKHAIGCQRYRPLSQYPATSRDVAFVANEDLAHDDVLQVIWTSKVKNLESVHLFDVFHDPEHIGVGKKSMAYSLVFRSAERTLKDTEVNDAHASVKQQLTDKLNVQLRE